MAGRWTANVTRSMLSPSFRVERATLEFAVRGDTMAATGDTLLISDKRFTKARHFRSTATSTPSGGVRSDLAFSSRRYLDRANDEVVLLDRKDQTGAELRHQLRQGGTPQFYFFDSVTYTFGPGINLLQKPGFEEYTPPALGLPGWVSDTPFRQTDAFSDTNQPYSGANNGACSTTDFLDCGIYQEVTAPQRARIC